MVVYLSCCRDVCRLCGSLEWIGARRAWSAFGCVDIPVISLIVSAFRVVRHSFCLFSVCFRFFFPVKISCLR